MKRKTFDDANRLAAELILSNPSKFGGNDGFPATWARCFLARLENQEKLASISRRESAA